MLNFKIHRILKKSILSDQVPSVNLPPFTRAAWGGPLLLVMPLGLFSMGYKHKAKFVKQLNPQLAGLHAPKKRFYIFGDTSRKGLLTS